MRFLFLFLPVFLHAADFDAKMTLSDDEISILEQLTVTLTLTYPPSYQPDLDAIGNHLLSYSGLGVRPFTLQKEEFSPPNFTFTLIPQREGDFTLTFYEIPFTNEEGKTVKVLSPLAPITITSAPVEANYQGVLAPLLDFSKTLPISISPSNRNRLIDGEEALKRERERNLEIFYQRQLSWGEIFLFFGTLALISFVYFRKPKVKVIGRKERLEKARKQALLSLKKEQSFDKLTGIIRSYISECCNINMQTTTTQEFLEKTKKHPLFKEDTNELLIDFLKLGDQVKFAHYSPSPTDCERAQESAKNFVEITSSRLAKS